MTSAGLQYTQDYALTVTLQPKYHKLAVEEQYDLLNNRINDILKQNRFVKITLIVELTKSFNIHGHGFIKIKLSRTSLRQMYDIFRNDKIIGYVYLKPIDDHVKWLDYTTKDIKQTMINCLSRDPIIIDQFDYIKKDQLFQAIIEENK